MHHPILRVNVSVYPDHMDFHTHANQANGWEATLEALKRVRAELDRNINEGPRKCPYAPKKEAR